MWNPCSHVPFYSHGHFRFGSSLRYSSVILGWPGVHLSECTECNIRAHRNLCRTVHEPSDRRHQADIFSFWIMPLPLVSCRVLLPFCFGHPSNKPLVIVPFLSLAEETFFFSLDRSSMSSHLFYQTVLYILKILRFPKALETEKPKTCRHFCCLPNTSLPRGSTL